MIPPAFSSAVPFAQKGTPFLLLHRPQVPRLLLQTEMIRQAFSSVDLYAEIATTFLLLHRLHVLHLLLHQTGMIPPSFFSVVAFA